MKQIIAIAHIIHQEYAHLLQLTYVQQQKSTHCSEPFFSTRKLGVNVTFHPVKFTPLLRSTIRVAVRLFKYFSFFHVVVLKAGYTLYTVLMLGKGTLLLLRYSGYIAENIAEIRVLTWPVYCKNAEIHAVSQQYLQYQCSTPRYSTNTIL